MSYYAIRKESFEKLRKFKFNIVDTLEDVYDRFAREFIDLVKTNNVNGKSTKVVLPVGPLEYRRVVKLSNKEGVSWANVVVFMMDEYCTEKGETVPYDHPLSFHRFMNENLFSLLDKDLRPSDENVVFPNPKQLNLVADKIKKSGKIDVCYGGFGINGHFAFNEPPESGDRADEESVRDSTTRIVDLSCETKTAVAIGSTFGNIDLIPPKAVTMGMKELLLAKEIHLYFMRTWHSGIMRRALFGPVHPSCPASYIQTHPKVTVTMASYVAKLPLVNVTQSIGLK